MDRSSEEMFAHCQQKYGYYFGKLRQLVMMEMSCGHLQGEIQLPALRDFSMASTLLGTEMSCFGLWFQIVVASNSCFVGDHLWHLVERTF